MHIWQIVIKRNQKTDEFNVETIDIVTGSSPNTSQGTPPKTISASLSSPNQGTTKLSGPGAKYLLHAGAWTHELPPDHLYPAEIELDIWVLTFLVEWYTITDGLGRGMGFWNIGYIASSENL